MVAVFFGVLNRVQDAVVYGWEGLVDSCGGCGLDADCHVAPPRNDRSDAPSYTKAGFLCSGLLLGFLGVRRRVGMMGLGRRGLRVGRLLRSFRGGLRVH